MFEPSRTHLSEEQMLIFRHMLKEEKLWVEVAGVIHWHRQNGIQRTKRNAHFKCALPFKDVEKRNYSGVSN